MGLRCANCEPVECCRWGFSVSRRSLYTTTSSEGSTYSGKYKDFAVYVDMDGTVCYFGNPSPGNGISQIEDNLVDCAPFTVPDGHQPPNGAYAYSRINGHLSGNKTIRFWSNQRTDCSTEYHPLDDVGGESGADSAAQLHITNLSSGSCDITVTLPDSSTQVLNPGDSLDYFFTASETGWAGYNNGDQSSFVGGLEFSVDCGATCDSPDCGDHSGGNCCKYHISAETYIEMTNHFGSGVGLIPDGRVYGNVDSGSTCYIDNPIQDGLVMELSNGYGCWAGGGVTNSSHESIGGTFYIGHEFRFWGNFRNYCVSEYDTIDSSYVRITVVNNGSVPIDVNGDTVLPGASWTDDIAISEDTGDISGSPPVSPTFTVSCNNVHGCNDDECDDGEICDDEGGTCIVSEVPVNCCSGITFSNLSPTCPINWLLIGLRFNLCRFVDGSDYECTEHCAGCCTDPAESADNCTNSGGYCGDSPYPSGDYFLCGASGTVTTTQPIVDFVRLRDASTVRLKLKKYVDHYKIVQLRLRLSTGSILTYEQVGDTNTLAKSRRNSTSTCCISSVSVITRERRRVFDADTVEDVTFSFTVTGLDNPTDPSLVVQCNGLDQDAQVTACDCMNDVGATATYIAASAADLIDGYYMQASFQAVLDSMPDCGQGITGECGGAGCLAGCDTTWPGGAFLAQIGIGVLGLNISISIMMLIIEDNTLTCIAIGEEEVCDGLDVCAGCNSVEKTDTTLQNYLRAALLCDGNTKIPTDKITGPEWSVIQEYACDDVTLSSLCCRTQSASVLIAEN